MKTNFLHSTTWRCWFVLSDKLTSSVEDEFIMTDYNFSHSRLLHNMVKVCLPTVLNLKTRNKFHHHGRCNHRHHRRPGLALKCILGEGACEPSIGPSWVGTLGEGTSLAPFLNFVCLFVFVFVAIQVFQRLKRKCVKPFESSIGPQLVGDARGGNISRSFL